VALPKGAWEAKNYILKKPFNNKKMKNKLADPLRYNTLTEQEKQEIDAINYSQMLKMWRHAPSEARVSLFSGDCGKYFAKVMSEKKAKLAPSEAVSISKMVGW
jgi:hypothetical protein